MIKGRANPRLFSEFAGTVLATFTREMTRALLASVAVIALTGCGSRHVARAATDPSLDSLLVSRVPEFQEITLDAGTVLALTLESPVVSNVSRKDDRVRARLNQPIVVNDLPVLPRGSFVDGIVSEVQRASEAAVLARVAVTFDTLVVAGTSYDIVTNKLTRIAAGVTAKDTELASPEREKEVRLKSGERVSVRLARPLTIRLPVDVS